MKIVRAGGGATVGATVGGAVGAGVLVVGAGVGGVGVRVTLGGVGCGAFAVAVDGAVDVAADAGAAEFASVGVTLGTETAMLGSVAMGRCVGDAVSDVAGAQPPRMAASATRRRVLTSR